MIARRTLFAVIAAAGLATSSACLFFGLARWAAGDLNAIAWEARREEEMDRELAVVFRINAGKAQVVAEVIAGRCALREAADRFRELDPTRLGGLAFSGEEALWRGIYLDVKEEVYLRGPRAAAEVLARLRAEYRQQFSHDPEEY
jgi:hypothetical protein